MPNITVSDKLKTFEAQLPLTRPTVLSIGHCVLNADERGLPIIDIASSTGLSQSSVSRTIKHLKDTDYVVQLPNRVERPGRPLQPVRSSESLQPLLAEYNDFHAAYIGSVLGRKSSDVMRLATASFAVGRELDLMSCTDLAEATGLHPETVAHVSLAAFTTIIGKHGNFSQMPIE